MPRRIDRVIVNDRLTARRLAGGGKPQIRRRQLAAIPFGAFHLYVDRTEKAHWERTAITLAACSGGCAVKQVVAFALGVIGIGSASAWRHQTAGVHADVRTV